MNHFVVLTITTDVYVFISKLYILVLTFLMHLPEICTVKPVYKGQSHGQVVDRWPVFRASEATYLFEAI